MNTNAVGMHSGKPTTVPSAETPPLANSVCDARVHGALAEGSPSAGPSVPEWRRPRFWALVAAALALVLVVEYKLHRAGQAGTGGVIEPLWPAHFFAFEGLDSDNRLVKFQRYVGRHEILLAFFDGRRGLQRCPQLLALREVFPRLKDRGAVVLAVTDAIPQENRAAFERVGTFPFPVVSDPTLEVQRRWHCLEAVRASGCVVFYIDRAGRVRVDDRGRPVPEPGVEVAVARVLGTTPEPARQ